MQTPKRWHVLAIFLLIVSAPPAAAMELALAESLAIERDPGLLALEQRGLAREASARADGTLPDPEVFIGAQGLPVDDPLDADMMTQYRIGFRQRLPAGDTLALRRESGNRETRALEARYQARKLEVLRQTRSAWVDWAAARQTLAVARSSRQSFEDLLAITEARYRAGTGRQRDISQARLELALLDERILERETAVDEAASRLERWTGRRPGEGREAQLPDWPNPPAFSRLENELHAHPSLAELEYRQSADESRVGLAREAYRPQWMIEAGYGHTRGNDPMTLNRQSDKLFAMVSFSLPLFTANRQDQRLAAAQAEYRARGHDIADRLEELRGELDRQNRLWQGRDQRLELLEKHVLVAAENTVESTMTSYRSDRASFDELIRARLALLDQELAAIDLRRKRMQAAVQLRYLAGETES
ncbi:TolC family protein [Wenzhouxiangella sp. EGI_FJ10305]|uniref:TolC family protein n=1 Tax=Wenzhouxiangella sp. EGI_FJ10305 TaxID=3243768 RepID=UPI0035DB19C6